MKNYVLLPIVAGLCSILLLASCKKEDKDRVEDTKQKLIGTWTVVQLAHDDNKNGVADATEIRDVDPDVLNTETFHANGTGTIILRTPDIDSSLNFSWSLQSDNQYLEIALAGAATATVKIKTLTDTDLHIENNQNPDGADWTYLKKR